MNQRPAKFQTFASGPAVGIPTEFGADLSLCIPINIQPHKLMKNPMLISEKEVALTPFQIAARADELAASKTPASGRIHLGEMMLDAKRLEAILTALVRRKKRDRGALPPADLRNKFPSTRGRSLKSLGGLKRPSGHGPGQLDAEAQKFLRVGVCFCFRINAQDRFSA